MKCTPTWCTPFPSCFIHILDIAFHILSFLNESCFRILNQTQVGEYSTFCISSAFALPSPTDMLMLILVLSRDSLPLSTASSTLGDTTAGDDRSSNRSSISSAYCSNCENDSNAAMHPVRWQLVSERGTSGSSPELSALFLLCGILCCSNLSLKTDSVT